MDPQQLRGKSLLWTVQWTLIANSHGAQWTTSYHLHFYNWESDTVINEYYDNGTKLKELCGLVTDANNRLEIVSNSTVYLLRKLFKYETTLLLRSPLLFKLLRRLYHTKLLYQISSSDACIQIAAWPFPTVRSRYNLFRRGRLPFQAPFLNLVAHVLTLTQNKQTMKWCQLLGVTVLLNSFRVSAGSNLTAIYSRYPLRLVKELAMNSVANALTRTTFHVHAKLSRCGSKNATMIRKPSIGSS